MFIRKVCLLRFIITFLKYPISEGAEGVEQKEFRNLPSSPSAKAHVAGFAGVRVHKVVSDQVQSPQGRVARFAGNAIVTTKKTTRSRGREQDSVGSINRSTLPRQTSALREDRGGGGMETSLGVVSSRRAACLNLVVGAVL